MIYFTLLFMNILKKYESAISIHWMVLALNYYILPEHIIRASA